MRALILTGGDPVDAASLDRVQPGWRSADLVIAELPIVFVDRVAGASKMAVVRTMVETELRVTWWGLALRAPRISDRLRQTAPGKYFISKIQPSGPPIVE